MSKINVNPNHYKVAGRERQGENILQERHRQKHAQSLARERFEQLRAAPRSPARAGRGALVPGPPPPGPSATSSATRAPARKRTPRETPRAKRRSTAEKAPGRKPSAGRAAVTHSQTSGNRGKRSTAQKRASSRNGFRSMPATRRVAGASGREPSRGSRKKR